MLELINWEIIRTVAWGCGLIMFFYIFFDKIIKSTEPKGKYKKRTNKPLAVAVKCGVGWQGYIGSGMASNFITGTCKTKKACVKALEIQGYEVRTHKLVA